jgi:hypothetical protein
MALTTIKTKVQGFPVRQWWFLIQVRIRAWAHGIRHAPEVQSLLANPPAHVTRIEVRAYYDALNPKHYLIRDSEPFVVIMLPYDWQLQPLSIATHYLDREVTDDITRIVVDCNGTRLFDSSGAPRLWCESASCDLSDLFEPRPAHNDAAVILRYFTKLPVSWTQVRGQQSVTATLGATGWTIHGLADS